MSIVDGTERRKAILNKTVKSLSLMAPGTLLYKSPRRPAKTRLAYLTDDTRDANVAHI